MPLKFESLVPVLSLLLGGLAAAADPLQPDMTTVKFLSFNIRYGTANDGLDSWPHRKSLVFDVIRDEAADFVGLQEALRFQIDEIRQALPGYDEIGVGRDDGKTAGEYSAILYRRDRWKPEFDRTRWLSDTPEMPGSKSWGNAIPRIVTWGRFRDLGGGCELVVFNTHFDHQSQPSRERSAAMVAALADEIPDEMPVVVMGDFNAGEDNPAIRGLATSGGDGRRRLADTFRVLHPDATPVGTFNGFRGTVDGAKIDYVFTRPSARVVTAEILRHQVEGRYPSDHFPVSAELRFDNPR